MFIFSFFVFESFSGPGFDVATWGIQKSGPGTKLHKISWTLRKLAQK